MQSQTLWGLSLQLQLGQASFKKGMIVIPILTKKGKKGRAGQLDTNQFIVNS